MDRHRADLDDDVRIPVDEGLRLREKAFWRGDLEEFGSDLNELFPDDEVHSSDVDGFYPGYPRKINGKWVAG